MPLVFPRQGSFLVCGLAVLCLLSALVSSDDLQTVYQTGKVGWLHVHTAIVRLEVPKNKYKGWCTTGSGSCAGCLKQEFIEIDGRTGTRNITLRDNERVALCLAEDVNGQESWVKSRVLTLPSTFAVKATLVASYYVTLSLIYGCTTFSPVLLAVAAAFVHVLSTVDVTFSPGAVTFVALAVGPLGLAQLLHSHPALASLATTALVVIVSLWGLLHQPLNRILSSFLSSSVNAVIWVFEYATLPAIVYWAGKRLQGKSQLAPYSGFLAVTLFGTHVARADIYATCPVLLPVLALLAIEYVLGLTDSVPVPAPAPPAPLSHPEPPSPPAPTNAHGSANLFVAGVQGRNSPVVVAGRTSSGNSAFKPVLGKEPAFSPSGSPAVYSPEENIRSAVQHAIDESGGLQSDAGADGDVEQTTPDDFQKKGQKRQRSTAQSVDDEDDNDVPPAKSQALL